VLDERRCWMRGDVGWEVVVVA